MSPSRLTALSDPEPLRTSPRRRPRRVSRPAEARAITEHSPLHSAEALAATMFVITVAVGWVALASTATAPLVAAGELLARAGRVFARP